MPIPTTTRIIIEYSDGKRDVIEIDPSAIEAVKKSVELFAAQKNEDGFKKAIVLLKSLMDWKLCYVEIFINDKSSNSRQVKVI